MNVEGQPEEDVSFVSHQGCPALGMAQPLVAAAASVSRSASHQCMLSAPCRSIVFQHFRYSPEPVLRNVRFCSIKWHRKRDVSAAPVDHHLLEFILPFLDRERSCKVRLTHGWRPGTAITACNSPHIAHDRAPASLDWHLQTQPSTLFYAERFLYRKNGDLSRQACDKLRER